MLVTMFPNLQKIASIGLTLPVLIASVEIKFLPDETNQTHYEAQSKGLTQLMRITIESPAQLTEEEIEVTLDIWNRKPRRIFI